MEFTDFGQIKIYEDLFSEFELKDVNGDALSCIKSKDSYYGMYNDIPLPIMIGSKFDKGYNPLQIKGYFVIDGICKSVNSIKTNQKINFSSNKAYLMDGSKIEIQDMFNYTITKNNKTNKWVLPINWKQILKYTEYKEELENHLNLINQVQPTTKRKIMKNEIDIISLCYMFECWLGLKEEPYIPWRLLTIGEILKNYVKNGGDIIKSFRTNCWDIGYNKNVTTISQNMTHYNLISDIESIRRITLLKSRENMNIYNRMVKQEDKYSICPVQTSDGSICGTVNYLSKDSTILTQCKIIELDFVEEDELFLYINNEFKGMININFINKLKDDNFIIYNYGIIYYAYYNYGFIIKGNCMESYAVSLLKYKYHNPPVRIMFTSSMLKQSICVDNRKISNLIDNTKTLVNEVDTLKVAIMPWYGYNIEDAIVISESTSRMYRYRKNRIYRECNIKIINKYVKIGEYVNIGQALYKKYNVNLVKTIEIVYAEDEGEIVELIFNSNYINIMTTKEKDLSVGDKMTSMHGQKGIVSLIEKDEDMPYYYKENQKIIIDLIINPHAFPSRMTIGQIIEMGNKEETVYIQNLALPNKIIVGRCQYMSLRHQVDDKFQFRNGGNFDPITRQVIGGRKNNGGLRFGQMERDILIGLDAWETIKELWNIDKINTYYCPKTGIFNPKCCKQEIKINQYFIICLSHMRALGYDILYNKVELKYSILKLDNSNIKRTDSLKFGDIDASDVRLYKDLILLPICLRSNILNSLYINYSKIKSSVVINEDKLIKVENDIIKETRYLLRNKNGVYHKYIEGHRVNHCIRSVIVPNPKLEIDTIEIPLEANINTNYGLLNRQPSLNSNSLKLVKLIHGKNKTIGINPLLCKSFNADFDGDEMNVYGIINKESIEELMSKISLDKYETQDYILENDIIKLTKTGLTANKKGIKMMIEKRSKGQQFNYEHMFSNIGEINECYYNGISPDNWYILAIAARISVASIALNTPITGQLQSLCVQKYI